MRARVLVALETSGPVASVGVSRNGRVLGRDFLLERDRHAAGLLPALDGILDRVRVSRSEITGVVVGTGPGSFTGIRVAAAAGKGISHALGLPLVGISSLTAAVLTEQATPGGLPGWPNLPGEGASTVSWTPPPVPERVVLFDARGDRLFMAAFRLGDGAPEVLHPPAFRRLAELLEDRALAGALHCGDGALRHAALLRGQGRTVLPAPLGFPSADGLLYRMTLSPEPTPVPDHLDWEPDYLRATAAERTRRS
ncbi:MAG: tRNA (adenosine(37)-N6)-threonylcarbamoyltransferase complex dimerization subunit type 1 TsaB [Gemmatimonadota bacterium]